MQKKITYGIKILNQCIVISTAENFKHFYKLGILPQLIWEDKYRGIMIKDI